MRSGGAWRTRPFLRDATLARPFPRSPSPPCPPSPTCLGQSKVGEVFVQLGDGLAARERDLLVHVGFERVLDRLLGVVLRAGKGRGESVAGPGGGKRREVGDGPGPGPARRDEAAWTRLSVETESEKRSGRCRARDICAARRRGSERAVAVAAGAEFPLAPAARGPRRGRGALASAPPASVPHKRLADVCVATCRLQQRSRVVRSWRAVRDAAVRRTAARTVRGAGRGRNGGA